MSYAAGLFGTAFALALIRTGVFGQNYIRLVDSERDKHQNIAVDDYVVVTHVTYSHTVAPFAPGSEKKISMFYFRPVDMDYIGKK
jgi:hypothetical protein